MIRILPRSLGGQLAALLVGGVLAAHAITVLVFFNERDEVVRATYQADLMRRIASLVSLIEEAPDDLRPRVLDFVDARRFGLRRQAESAIANAPMQGGEWQIAQALDDAVAPRRQGVRVRMPEEREPPPGAPRRRRGPEPSVLFSIPLNDGSWLNGRLIEPRPLPRLSWVWVAPLIASALVILAVVAVMVGRITRPMRALANAAEKVGRGEAVKPVVADGPQEVRTTVETFNAMQDRLHRFVSDRTRMLAAISHDLRTPITSLRLRAELVDDEELRQAMIATLDEMQTMTAATLAFAKEEAGDEEARTVDLSALIEGLVEDFAAMGHTTVFTGPDRYPYRCRPASLKRAFANMVDNAVHYGGSAKVTLTAGEGGPVIVVEDEGPGIPPERIEEMFEPFARLEGSRSRETGGIGLGLAIARSIVRGHGGELVLANRPEGGLRATIQLPPAPG